MSSFAAAWLRDGGSGSAASSTVAPRRLGSAPDLRGGEDGAVIGIS